MFAESLIKEAKKDEKIGTVSNKMERGCTGTGCKPVERIKEELAKGLASH